MNNLGNIRTKALELFSQHGLNIFRDILTPLDFVNTSASTIKKPTRKRVLIPEVVFWLMMLAALESSAMAAALSMFWEDIYLTFTDLPLKVISEAAFCKARKRLPLSFFKNLFFTLRNRFLEKFSPLMLWKGYQVFAIDGTTVALPPIKRLLKHFGAPSNQNGQSKNPQARLVAAISVFCGFCINFAVVPYNSTEHAALRQLIPQFGSEVLLLLDAGFFSFIALYRMTEKQGLEFLMRVPKSLKYKVVKELGPNEWIVELRPSTSVKRDWPELPEKLPLLRLIRYQIPGYRPSYLLTSILDPTIALSEELVALYHRRWQIETVYYELKCVLNIQNLRSESKVGIEKEFYTQLIMNNLVRWIMTEAAQEQGCYPVDLSFEEAVRAVKAALPHIAVATPLEIARIYRKVVNRIKAAKIRKRPGRYYPRPGDGKPKNKGGGKYVQSARLAA